MYMIRSNFIISKVESSITISNDMANELYLSTW